MHTVSEESGNDMMKEVGYIPPCLRAENRSTEMDIERPNQSIEVDIERPQLYFFLLPFTFVSLIIYAQILFEIIRNRRCSLYDSFFFRMICSQSIYDISYVIMYFVMELPQDWPSLDGFYLGMNDTIIPHLIYAHTFLCTIAQILGITMMSTSRMLLVCHPTLRITKLLKQISFKKVIIFHCIIPACYACYIVIAHGWRYYGCRKGRVSRFGNQASVTINSQVLCGFGLAGTVVSAACYIKIFLTLRKRPRRTWSRDAAVLATSFVLFLALCIITIYFIANIYVRTALRKTDIYYTLRDHSYAFTFLLSLANPWCLIVSSASIRQALLSRCLPTCCARIQIIRVLLVRSTNTAAATRTATSIATVSAKSDTL